MYYFMQRPSLLHSPALDCGYIYCSVREEPMTALKDVDPAADESYPARRHGRPWRRPSLS